MRTTINLPDDVAEILRSFADVKGISLGDAVAELVRKGLQPRPPATDRKCLSSIRHPGRIPAHYVGADPGCRRRKMRPYLLDTNILIALAWRNHVHHSEVTEWFRGKAAAHSGPAPLPRPVLFGSPRMPRFRRPPCCREKPSPCFSASSLFRAMAFGRTICPSAKLLPLIPCSAATARSPTDISCRWPSLMMECWPRSIAELRRSPEPFPTVWNSSAGN